LIIRSFAYAHKRASDFANTAIQERLSPIERESALALDPPIIPLLFKVEHLDIP